jgi:hypothetical protein
MGAQCERVHRRWRRDDRPRRAAGVHIGAAKIFGADDFAGGGFHQRRAAEEDGALVAHDDGFIAHGRHVGAARGA